jgi:hypothetical protein
VEINCFFYGTGDGFELMSFQMVLRNWNHKL